MTREEIERAKEDLETGRGGGNTTQVCIEALQLLLDNDRELPLIKFASEVANGRE